MLVFLDARAGDIYRVEVRFAGTDPRVSLRETNQLSPDELLQIAAKLARLDAASRAGAWTLEVLRVIERHPKVVSTVLAKQTGFDKEWLETNIRKLKNLGLTISHDVGYELSPRGRVVLNAASRLPREPVDTTGLRRAKTQRSQS